MRLARITSVCKSLDVAITSAIFDFIKRDCSDDVVVTRLAPLSALLICIEISVEQSAIGYRRMAINHFVALADKLTSITMRGGRGNMLTTLISIDYLSIIIVICKT